MLKAFGKISLSTYEQQEGENDRNYIKNAEVKYEKNHLNSSFLLSLYLMTTPYIGINLHYSNSFPDVCDRVSLSNFELS